MEELRKNIGKGTAIRMKKTKFGKIIIIIGLLIILFFLILSKTKKSDEERAYDVACEKVRQSSSYVDSTYYDYDSKYVKVIGKDLYNVEVHVTTTNVYMLQKEYVYDVNIEKIGDGRFIANSCELRVRD